MRLLVLTARPDVGTNRRLVEGGRVAGVDVEIVDASQAVVQVGGGPTDILLGGRSVFDPKPRAAIARVGNWRPETMLAMVEALQGAGIPTPNGPEAFRAGRDHWQSLLMLSQAGLPVPKTLAAMDPERTATAAVLILGLPVVVKLRRSRMGVGVIVCRQLDHLESVLDSLWRLGDEYVVQEWIECGGRSTRVLVAGDRPIGSAHFEAANGEWRSNGARGGSAQSADLHDSQAELAVAAGKALGLGLCGVDLLEGRQGTVVCEVNPTPGFKQVEQATGIDVASEIVRYAVGLEFEKPG
ncbi:MAG: RimK family alpha-L-glutamate ligase [Acidobacteriota bacterium]